MKPNWSLIMTWLFRKGYYKVRLICSVCKRIYYLRITNINFNILCKCGNKLVEKKLRTFENYLKEYKAINRIERKEIIDSIESHLFMSNVTDYDVATYFYNDMIRQERKATIKL